MNLRKFIPALALLSAVIAGGVPATSLAELEIATKGENERTVVTRISATITAIDAKDRDVTLRGPLGNTFTVNVSDKVTRFDEFAVGDQVQATYVEALSGNLQAPTPEDLANPWVELNSSGIADDDMPPAAAVGRAVKAVCTIEGMNRASETLTIMDPRGKLHVIKDIKADRMNTLSLGEKIVVTYTQAVALTLEKSS